MYLGNKRGLSPLVATVILIGFAVSIGAVIMNWGKSAFEDHEQEAEGEELLKWYLGGNIESVCYDDTKIQFNVKGSPEINIKAIKVIARGQKDEYVPVDVINVPEKGKVNKVILPFNILKYGILNQLIFYPFDIAITRDNPVRCS
ncbi:hypothetical protein HQ529_00615 [Candidatus Woesearchaeota archaeon]|nr:hypothetical protein [Candidatus Woesearchaeota archaeon]